MNKVGLDFGTTNSTLSFMDPNNQNLECYRMRSAGSSPYIPSFVRFEKEDNSVEIGRAARKSLGDEEYLVFSEFKMLLAENDEKKLENYGYIVKKPPECAKAYIKHLLDSYCQEQNLGNGIDEVIITVPEIWVKENRHASRETLKNICNELSLPLKRFMSEPVAASAYFAHCFKQRTNKWFNGNVLVCDYGGGTLDLSLSKTEEGQITVLECTGKGHDEKTLGRAGAAFDAGVIGRAYAREKGKKISRNDPQFMKLMDAFEEQKIERKSDVDKKLAQYLKNSAVDKKVFQIDGITFKASDLVEVFNPHILPDLEHAFKEMKEYFKHHNIDYQDREHFRVVMAGGFSCFYLVQESVRKMFGAGSSTDSRFDDCFTVEDIALAISKGAALVANEQIAIDPTCPVSIGLVGWSDMGDGVHEKIDIPFIKKGAKLSQYYEPKLSEQFFEVSKYRGEIDLIIFIGDGENRKHFKLGRNTDELFPNSKAENNRWQIGFSVDDNYIFSFYARDIQGNVKETRLGDLLDKYSGVIGSKEEK